MTGQTDPASRQRRINMENPNSSLFLTGDKTIKYIRNKKGLSRNTRKWSKKHS
jgi:hypothetical protein